MTTTATLVTKFVADTNEFNSKIKSAENSVGSLSSKISLGMAASAAAFVAAGAAVGEFLSQLNQSAERISKLYDNTQKLGVTVAAFQALSIAAREAGLSSEGLQNILAKMNVNLGDASLNGGKTQQALKALGISLKDLSGLDAIQKFQFIIEKLKLVNDVTVKAKLGADIFSKGFKEAIGLVNSQVDDSVTKIKTLGASLAQSQSSVSFENLQKILNNTSNILGSIAGPSEKAKQALQSLGLSLKDISGKGSEQQLQIILERLGAVTDATTKSKLAADIFGDSFKTALALTNNGITETAGKLKSLSIEDTTEKIRSLGITLTQSQAAGLDKLAETKELIGSVWEGFKDNIAAEVAPGFQELSDRVLEGIQGMGGLKDAAKGTADFIVGAMNVMAKAIGAAVIAIKLAKSVYDDTIGGAVNGILSKAGQGFSLAFQNLKKLFDSQSSGVENYFKNVATSNQYADNGPIFGSSGPNGNRATTSAQTSLSSISSSSMKVAEEISASKVISEYADKQKVATKATEANIKALEKMKTAAEKTATFLDGFSQIKNAFEAPGKQQATDIINQGVKDQNRALVDPISSGFQRLYTEALTGHGDNQAIINKLQAIIDVNKSGYSPTGQYSVRTRHYSGSGDGNEDLTRTYYTPMLGQNDTSGLTTALNELKAYLGSKTNKQQEVQVNIKVEKGPDFVTTITKDVSFKEAVDAQFDERTARAARGI